MTARVRTWTATAASRAAFERRIGAVILTRTLQATLDASGDERGHRQQWRLADEDLIEFHWQSEQRRYASEGGEDCRRAFNLVSAR